MRQRVTYQSEMKYVQRQTKKTYKPKPVSLLNFLLYSGADCRFRTGHLMIIKLAFPHTVAVDRTMLYDEMEALRGFRNRTGHHEPIFAYPLDEHHARIIRLIKSNCGDTAEWLTRWVVVTAAIAASHKSLDEIKI
jgi:hypothetical protein